MSTKYYATYIKGENETTPMDLEEDKRGMLKVVAPLCLVNSQFYQFALPRLYKICRLSKIQPRDGHGYPNLRAYLEIYQNPRAKNKIAQLPLYLPEQLNRQ